MTSYTIDTLEKLCHNETTAEKACLLFYKLANSNNELKTEAETAFSDLFYIALSETTLTLDKRIEILTKIEQEFGVTDILIEAYRKSLKSTSFIGKIRNSNEAFKRNYYLPNNPEENQRYFKNSINKLIEFIMSDKEYSDAAKKAFYSQMSEQVYNGERILMLESLKKLIHKEGKIETEIRNLLLEYNTENNFFSEEVNKMISDILDEYKPQSIEEELITIVIEAPWLYSKNPYGHNDNISSAKAGELAIKYCLEGTVWLDKLNILLKGEQRQTFYFAQKIGVFFKDKNKEDLIERIVEGYNQISPDEQNSVFVNGLVSGVNDDSFTREIITKLMSTPNTEIHGLRQVRFLNPIKFDDINNLKNLITQNPEYLKNLEYLKLKNFTKEEFIDTLQWIKEINSSFAIEMLYEITRSEINKYDVENWDKYRDVINEHLYCEGILKSSTFYNSSYHLETLFTISINEDPSEIKIKFLITEILKEYEDYNTRNNSLLDRLTYYLLEEYWDASWKYYGEYFSNSKAYNFSLNHFLDRYKFNNDKLYDWVVGDNENRPAIAIKFMKVFDNDENGILTWNPIAKKIIDEFGQQRKVLENLSSKLSSYSINTYTAESLYRDRKRLVEELLDHQLTEVVDYAKIEIDYLEKRIEEEKKFGENYELGR